MSAPLGQVITPWVTVKERNTAGSFRIGSNTALQKRLEIDLPLVPSSKVS